MFELQEPVLTCGLPKKRTPCADCADRKEACHSTCERYKEYSVAIAEMRESRRLGRETDRVYWNGKPRRK